MSAELEAEFAEVWHAYVAGRKGKPQAGEQDLARIFWHMGRVAGLQQLSAAPTPSSAHEERLGKRLGAALHAQVTDEEYIPLPGTRVRSRSRVPQLGRVHEVRYIDVGMRVPACDIHVKLDGRGECLAMGRSDFYQHYAVLS